MGLFERVRDTFVDGSSSPSSVDPDGQRDSSGLEPPDDSLAIPNGVDFRFHVEGRLSENHKSILSNWVQASSLTDYFNRIDVQFETVGGRYPNPPDIPTSDTGVRINQLPPDDSLVRIWCPERVRGIPGGSEDRFYNEVREVYSDWFLGALDELDYDGELIEMLIVERFL